MAAPIKSDNPLDLAIEKNKRELAALQIKISGLIAAFPQLPAKERAKRLSEVTGALSSIQKFIDQSKAATLTNAGSRFGLENIRTAYSSLLGRWRKFEKSLGEL